MDFIKISVVTICYNAVTQIEKTILSVLNQTYPNIEYIIIDGNSYDGTIEIIKKYTNRIDIWISEQDKGIYDAMNKGILLASGDYIQFLNAGDTYYTSNCLSDFVPQITDSTIIAYGLVNFQYSIMNKVRQPYPLEYMSQRMPFFHPATFVKVSYHKQHLFDTSFKSSGDYDFLYKAYFKDKVKFQYINIIIANFEAETGISMTNYSLRKKEDARVKGIEKSIRWKFRYWGDLCIHNIKQKIKLVVPESYLLKRKKRFIELLP